jgi:hypothetical protein
MEEENLNVIVNPNHWVAKSDVVVQILIEPGGKRPYVGPIRGKRGKFGQFSLVVDRKILFGRKDPKDKRKKCDSQEQENLPGPAV